MPSSACKPNDLIPELQGRFLLRLSAHSDSIYALVHTRTAPHRALLALPTRRSSDLIREARQGAAGLSATGRESCRATSRTCDFVMPTPDSGRSTWCRVAAQIGRAHV